MQCFLCGFQQIEVMPKIDLTTRVYCPVCGRYTIGDIVIQTKQLESEKDRKYLLCALSRRASDAGNPITITMQSIHTLFDAIPRASSPLENIDQTLLLLTKKFSRADELIDPKLDTDYPLVLAHDPDEFRYFLEILSSQGLLETPEITGGGHFGRVRLTPRGWQRALEIRKTHIDSDQAFVAMSFATELNEAWENGFKPALKTVGFNAYRADQDEHNEKIDDRIISEIRRSGLLVADFTGHRGGVYFEAGFAMGLGIPVIWTCRESDIANAHFDTRQYNHIVWSDPADIISKLTLRINATIPLKARSDS